MPTSYEQLTASEISGLSPGVTVFFFPIASLEDHGPHLPVGADLFEASQACWILAERLEQTQAGWRGIIMPSAPLGVDTTTGPYSIRVRPHVLRDWLVDACWSLARHGFYQFVAYSGCPSPKQMVAIDEGARVIRRRARLRFGKIWNVTATLPTLVCANLGAVGFQDFLNSPSWLDPKEHGGARDTSIALRYFPESVKPIFSSLPAQERLPTKATRYIEHLFRRLRGYWGNPSAASADQGEALLKAELEPIFIKLQAVWQGGVAKNIFPNWPALWPGNKSFFKAWVLAILVFLGMMIWLYLNVAYILEMS